MGRRRKKVTARKTYVVVVDGETEVWYFNMLKRNNRQLSISIKPELPTKKTLSELYEKVVEAAQHYTKVFWIIDFDTIVKETREAKAAKKGGETPLLAFSRYRRNLAKDYPNAIVIVNAPCLEFWFLLHYKETARFFEQCENAEAALKRFMKDYAKTKEFFTKEGSDIYLRLLPHLEEAKAHAKKLGTFDEYEPYKALAEAYLFFEDEAFS